MYKKLFFSVILSSMIFLTGCRGDVDLNPDQIHVDFKTLEVVNTADINTISIDSLELNDERITDENVEQIRNNVKFVYNALGNYEYFMKNIGNINDYYNIVKDFFSEEFYDKIITSNCDYIYETMMNIYKKENAGYYETNLIEIIVTNEKMIEIKVEVLSIQNNSLFSEINKITLTNDFKISDIKILESIHSVESSVSPVYNKNISNANNNFSEALSLFLSSITNKQLYDKYESMLNGTFVYEKDENKEEKNAEINLQIETLLTKDNFNIETLKKLFEIGKGIYEDYGVVSYRIMNEENKEETIYTVGFVCNKEITYFDFTYSRLLNEIISCNEKD